MVPGEADVEGGASRPAAADGLPDYGRNIRSLRLDFGSERARRSGLGHGLDSGSGRAARTPEGHLAVVHRADQGSEVRAAHHPAGSAGGGPRALKRHGVVGRIVVRLCLCGSRGSTGEADRREQRCRQSGECPLHRCASGFAERGRDRVHVARLLRPRAYWCSDWAESGETDHGCPRAQRWPERWVILARRQGADARARPADGEIREDFLETLERVLLHAPRAASRPNGADCGHVDLRDGQLGPDDGGKSALHRGKGLRRLGPTSDRAAPGFAPSCAPRPRVGKRRGLW